MWHMKAKPINLIELGRTLTQVLDRKVEPTCIRDVTDIVFADQEATVFIAGEVFTPTIPPAWQLNFIRFVKAYGSQWHNYPLIHAYAATAYLIFQLTERVLKKAAESDNAEKARALLSPDDNGGHLIAAYIILTYPDLPPGKQWDELRRSAAELYAQAGFSL
jgi:hypothetical protein